MFSTIQRAYSKQTLENYRFDVLIIGGGITGAGIALDAVTRGLTVALIDMQDFAAGTSSRSTKLIHGGLRYLKNFEVKLVAETGKEREIVYRNAMHVTTPERMLLPFYKDGTFGQYTTSAGLLLYDKLAGVKKNERRRMLSAAEAAGMEPLLKREGLIGGGHYVEYKTDDARLTIEVLKQAAEEGAVCLNYTKALRFVYDNGKICGVHAHDKLTGDHFRLDAKAVINAAGPWVDEVRSIDAPAGGKQLRMTKGVHIVLDKSIFPLRQAVYFDAPDGRMIFAVPRGEKAYVGTTDTVFNGQLTKLAAEENDIEYLLQAVHHTFPSVHITRPDVESTWAGVRPLILEEGKKPSEISRKDEIWETDSGLLSIAGGKLTGYRKMAEKVIDHLAERKDINVLHECQTKNLRLSGGHFQNEDHFRSFMNSKANEAQQYGLSINEGKYIASRYGTNADQLFIYAHAFRKMQNSELPLLLQAELFYAIHHEMAVSLSDFFIRRTGALYFQIECVQQYKKAAAAFMAKHTSSSPEQKERSVKELNNHIKEALGKAGENQ